MRTADAVRRVRRLVDDPSPNFFTDVDVYDELNIAHRDLFRRKAEADESWGTVDYTILKGSTRIEQLSQNRWLYHLPSFVYRINEVRRLLTDQDSPTDATPAVLTFREHDDSGTGWRFKSDRAIVLQGFGEAPSIKLEIAKTPARLLFGVVKAGCTTTQLVVDVTQGAHSFDLEDGSLVGAQFEITSKKGANDARGVVAVVKAASRAGSDLTLTITPPLPAAPLANEDFDMHIELSDVNVDLVLLRTTEALLMKQSDAVPLGILRSRIEAAEMRFIESLQPRYGGGPRNAPQGSGERYDPDRDQEWN